MDPDDVAKLNEHRVVLVNEMETSSVVDYLLSSSILFNNHEDKIISKPAKAEKNRELLRILITRGPNAFKKFVEALISARQQHLAEMITFKGGGRVNEAYGETSDAAIRKQLIGNNENCGLSQNILSTSKSIDSDVFSAAQNTLQNLYKKNFRKVNPFSLPFTFDIQNTIRASTRHPVPLGENASIEKEQTFFTASPPTADFNRLSVKKISAVAIKKWSPLNFVKQEELGRGGFGVVYKCFDFDAQRFFVAKETVSQAYEALEIAKNEINRLKDVKHPRIVDYYGCEIEGTIITIFMEYMSAGSIRQIIENFGFIKETTSIKYVDQILDGLSYLHKKGIVHCDLKCDNILNDGQGNVKLGDLGMAVQKTLNTANQSYFSHDIKGGGTFYWMAPEVMNGGGCSRCSDIWSLGCVIVEMLTGLPPYRKWPMPKFIGSMYIESLSYEPNQLVPNASDKMKNFLSNLLQYEPKNRPQTAMDTIAIFRNVFDNASATADEFQSIEFSSDPAQWPSSNEKLRSYWILKGWPPQNISSRKKFLETRRSFGKNTRFLTLSAFYPQIQNKETVLRRWLVYSPSTYSVYCSICKLFGKSKSYFTEGHTDWHNLGRILVEHETSISHLEAILLFSNLRKNRGVDSSLQNHMRNQMDYWRKFLYRVVEVVRFLSVRILALRGDNEIIGSLQNGNFLGILELIAKFDDFTAEHLKKYGNSGRGNVSYISSTIVEEFIQHMADKVMETIVLEIKEAKYFAISVDSTPDVSHIDQLTFIVRYFTKHGTAVERFLSFLPIADHHGIGLADEVLKFLKRLKIDIGDCRGQCYDNAANMAGRYQGLQARILTINRLAKYSPCTAHSLNLIGEAAVKASPCAAKFFRYEQKIYNFFASSTFRWKLLSDALSQSENRPKVVKSLSETRWSARADAVSALTEQLDLIQGALIEIAANNDLDMEIRNEAESLLRHSLKSDFCLMCSIWKRILLRFDNVSNSLQQSDLDLSAAILHLQSLCNFITAIEDDFSVFQQEANLLMKNGETVVQKKQLKLYGHESHLRKQGILDEKNFTDLLSKLQTELRKRLMAYDEVRGLFGIVTRFPRLDNKDIVIQCSKLVNEYSSDLRKELADEFISLKAFVPPDLKSASDIFSRLIEMEILSSFPNVYVAFRIFLTMMPTNCTGERSFSKLKLVESERRSSMGQSRLSALSLLSIESVIMNSLDFTQIINDFATKKCRKKRI